jgi:voltage-gated potassium channel
MNTYNALIDVAYLLIFLLIIGTIGFKYFASLQWIDALQTTVFYITGLGSNTNMQSFAAKIWSCVFALIGTTIFIGIAVNIVADIVEKRFIKTT